MKSSYTSFNRLALLSPHPSALFTRHNIAKRLYTADAKKGDFDFVLVDSGIHSIASLSSRYTQMLQGLGGRSLPFTSLVPTTPSSATPDVVPAVDKPFVMVALTGGSERKMLDAYKVYHSKWTEVHRREVASMTPQPPPALVLAHSTQNSLPAALETVAKMQQDGVRSEVVYLTGKKEQSDVYKIKEAIRGRQLALNLQSTRIGQLGKASEWLVASEPSPTSVRTSWGPTLLPIPLAELEELYFTQQDQSKQDALHAANELMKGATQQETHSHSHEGEHEGGRVEHDEAVKATRLMLALKSLVSKHNLQAVTVRCFDLLFSVKTSGCVALAQLNDEGMTAGCEGDVVSTIGLMWASSVMDMYYNIRREANPSLHLPPPPPWMANPSRIDLDEKTLTLAHCTVPRKLVKEYQLVSHFESGIGVSIQGDIAAGGERDITVFRIGGKDIMRQLWIAEGEKCEIPLNAFAADLCRTQLTIRFKGEDATQLDEVLAHPLGNHMIVMVGKWKKELLQWWKKHISV